MCGFIYSTTKFESNSTSWNSAQESILCRGPDQQGELLSQCGSFFHSRLSIIGSNKEGQQPFRGKNSESILVFNGEIYNYQAIADQLQIRATSDTEVLYTILESNRYELLRNLQGIFSFVFVSQKEQIILALRDQFGVKPMYFSNVQGELIFASVLAPILLLNSENGLDLDSIERFLATGAFPLGKTLVKNAQELESGVLHEWNLDTRELISTERIDYKPLYDLNLSLSESLNQAVVANLTSDVPVGLMLSGGVDSTLLASIAALNGKSLDCFTLTNPEDSSINEASYARFNSNNLNLNLVEVPIDYSALNHHMDAILKSSGEPFGDPAFLLLRELSMKIVKTHKTVLAGEGADELFGGYARYKINSFRASRTGKYLKNIGLSKFIKSPRLDTPKPLRILFAILTRDDFDAHSSLLGHNWELAAALMQRVPGAQKKIDREKWNANQPSSLGYPFSRFRIYDVENTLIGTYLEKSDRASMSCGLEVRVPFLDQGLVHSLIRSKSEENGKQFLKSELHKVFPGVSLPGKKMGLSVNINKIIKNLDLESSLKIFYGIFHPSQQLTNIDFERYIKYLEADKFLAFRLITLAKCLEIWRLNV